MSAQINQVVPKIVKKELIAAQEILQTDQEPVMGVSRRLTPVSKGHIGPCELTSPDWSQMLYASSALL
jgi:hypothetical protein